MSTDTWVSDCCSAPLIVTGGLTQHWECKACGKPCDRGERDDLEDYLTEAMTDPVFRAAFQAVADDDEPDDECDGGDRES